MGTEYFVTSAEHCVQIVVELLDDFEAALGAVVDSMLAQQSRKQAASTTIASGRASKWILKGQRVAALLQSDYTRFPQQPCLHLLGQATEQEISTKADGEGNHALEAENCAERRPREHKRHPLQEGTCQRVLAPTMCIEIKPKCGVLPCEDALQLISSHEGREVRRTKERFEMHQVRNLFLSG